MTRGERSHNHRHSLQFARCLFSHRDVLRVHELHSKVVRLHQINVIHDLIEEVLTFGFTLQRRDKKKKIFTARLLAFLIISSLYEKYITGAKYLVECGGKFFDHLF